MGSHRVRRQGSDHWTSHFYLTSSRVSSLVRTHTPHSDKVKVWSYNITPSSFPLVVADTPPVVETVIIISKIISNLLAETKQN